MCPEKAEMIGNQKFQNRFVYLNQLFAFLKSSFFTLGLSVLISIGGTSLAFAQSWQKLNEDQRSVLAPLQEDWSSLTPSRRGFGQKDGFGCDPEAAPTASGWFVDRNGHHPGPDGGGGAG